MTWSTLVTADGAISLAASIILLVQVLKSAIPGLFTRLTGASVALIVSLVLYVAGFVFAGAGSADILAWGLAWLGCAAAAIGVHSAITQGTSTFVPPAS